MRFLLPLLLTFVAQTAIGADLPSVLSKMDAASAQYKGMKADIRNVKYTKLVDDTAVEAGQVWVRRDSKGAIALRIVFTEPVRKQVRVEGSTAEIFTEPINQIEEYDLKSQRDRLEEAMLLGYGVSGKDLQARYDIKLVGEDDLEGQPAVHLAMVPKDEEDRAAGKTVDIWVSTETWQPIQQRANESDGDYRLVSYSDITINPGVKTSDLEFDLSRTTKKPKRVKTKI